VCRRRWRVAGCPRRLWWEEEEARGELRGRGRELWREDWWMHRRPMGMLRAGDDVMGWSGGGNDEMRWARRYDRSQT
jgi:hypothetical protein